MNIPKIIHFTIPECPSQDQLKNIEVARELHPDWSIKVWQDPVDKAPFRLSRFWDKTNSGAQLADLIRLEVVYQHGGFYLDSDFVLRRSLEPLRTFPFVIASEDGLVATNAFFGASPNSPVILHLIDTLDRNEVDWKLPPHLTTGPNFFAREIRWHGGVTVIPRETFYPLHWIERGGRTRQWTYGNHAWDYSWRATTGTDRPVRAFIRQTRWHLTNFRRRMFVKARNLALSWRQLSQIHRPSSFSANGVICAQTVHGLKMYLSGEDGSITPEIALQGTYEFREEMFIKRVLRPGDWVLDVGANVGIFSLIAAQRVGPFGRVFSYEPNPLVAELLRRSLVVNWLHDRCELRSKAVGSQASTMRLHFCPNVLGGASLAPQECSAVGAKSSSGNQQEIDVEVSTLDTDFPVDLPIRLLKIDVEGFESEVLRGATRLLQRQCVDIVMMECLPEMHGDRWHQFTQELQAVVGCGYSPYRLNRSSKLCTTPLTNVFYGDGARNIVLVSEDAKPTIRELS